MPPQNPPQPRAPEPARRRGRIKGWVKRRLTHPRTTWGFATLAGSALGYALGTAIAGPAGAFGVYPGMAAAWGVERAVRRMTARVRARRALQPARTPKTAQVSRRKAAELRSRNKSHARHGGDRPRRGKGRWSRKQRPKTPEIKASWLRMYIGENIRWGSLQGIGGLAVSASAHNFGLMVGYMGIVPIVSAITATQAYIEQRKVSAKEREQNERHSAAASRDNIHEARLDEQDSRLEAMVAVLEKISQGQQVSPDEIAAARGTPASQGTRAGQVGAAQVHPQQAQGRDATTGRQQAPTGGPQQRGQGPWRADEPRAGSGRAAPDRQQQTDRSQR